MGVLTGGLREVYGRSSNKTSRLETPINTGVSKGDGRSNCFYGLHVIYQDSAGSVFFAFDIVLLSIKFITECFFPTLLYLPDIQAIAKLRF